MSQQVRNETKRIGMVMALAATLLFVIGSPAWASTGINGPTPPALGDPATGNVSPHGGYSSSTDFCLQCHSAHNQGDEGQYALLFENTVTATCQTCHGLPAYGGGGTSPRDSNAITGFTTGIMGTASSRSAYDITTGMKSSHPLLATSTAGTGDNVQMQDSGWTYSGTTASWIANQEPAGLSCTSCHTSHGNWGQLVNSERGVIRTTADGDGLSDTDPWVDGAPIYVGRTLKYLNLGADGVWETCTDAAGTTGCLDFTMTDSEGQTVYGYGYKLLSAYPNFNWAGGGESWGLDASAHDQGRWCGSCHPNKVDVAYGGTFHNHPTGCTACHGNPTGDATSTDFPHTSKFGEFLKAYPDGLCISCHNGTTRLLP